VVRARGASLADLMESRPLALGVATGTAVRAPDILKERRDDLRQALRIAGRRGDGSHGRRSHKSREEDARRVSRRGVRGDTHRCKQQDEQQAQSLHGVSFQGLVAQCAYQERCRTALQSCSVLASKLKAPEDAEANCVPRHRLAQPVDQESPSSGGSVSRPPSSPCTRPGPVRLPAGPRGRPGPPARRRASRPPSATP
jgi:hypothetical protein